MDCRVKPGNDEREEDAMIYELRTYTIRTGGLADQVKAASTLSREIRGDNYGKLEGYWSTEIGPLNQVMHLWSYSDLNERARLRGELAKNPRWTGEYLKQTAGLVVRQDIRLIESAANAMRGDAALIISVSGLVERVDTE